MNSKNLRRDSKQKNSTTILERTSVSRSLSKNRPNSFFTPSLVSNSSQYYSYHKNEGLTTKLFQKDHCHFRSENSQAHNLLRLVFERLEEGKQLSGKQQDVKTRIPFEPLSMNKINNDHRYVSRNLNNFKSKTQNFSENFLKKENLKDYSSRPVSKTQTVNRLRIKPTIPDVNLPDHANSS